MADHPQSDIQFKFQITFEFYSVIFFLYFMGVKKLKINFLFCLNEFNLEGEKILQNDIKHAHNK